MNTITKKTAIGAAAALALAALASNAQAAYWTPWVSEEGGGPATICTGWNEGARGFGCRGRYCDDVHMLCDTLPAGISLDPATDRWSGWFSEEWDYVSSIVSSGWYRVDQINYEVCEAGLTGGVLNGIRCSGSNCDSVSIECAVPRRPNGTFASPVNCAWSSSISEEAPGQVDFGVGRFITGVWCSGRYCDNMSFYVCGLQ